MKSKNKIRNKNHHLDLMNITNKTNSIINKTRRTFSHSFSNKDLNNNKNVQKKISKDNVNKEIYNNLKIHENANTISIYENSNFRIGFKRFNKIPIGRISYRAQKNKYNLKNESLEALVHLSKEKKNLNQKLNLWINIMKKIMKQ